MTKEKIDIFLKENYGRVSTGYAASVTGLTKDLVATRWRRLKNSSDFKVPEPMEPVYKGTYTFIPEIKARVKLKPGQTAEQYLQKIKRCNEIKDYHNGAKKEERWNL